MKITFFHDNKIGDDTTKYTSEMPSPLIFPSKVKKGYFSSTRSVLFFLSSKFDSFHWRQYHLSLSRVFLKIIVSFNSHKQKH